MWYEQKDKHEIDILNHQNRTHLPLLHLEKSEAFFSNNQVCHTIVYSFSYIQQLGISTLTGYYEYHDSYVLRISACVQKFYHVSLI